MAKFPTFDLMFNPLLTAMKDLGGSGTNEEIESRVAELMGLSAEQLEIHQDPKRPGRTKFQYRLAWARTYLGRYGVLENSARGVWALTSAGRNTIQLNEKEVEHISKIVSNENHDTSQMNESEVILQKTIIANQNAAIVL